MQLSTCSVSIHFLLTNIAKIPANFPAGPAYNAVQGM